MKEQNPRNTKLIRTLKAISKTINFENYCTDEDAHKEVFVILGHSFYSFADSMTLREGGAL